MLNQFFVQMAIIIMENSVKPAQKTQAHAFHQLLLYHAPHNSTKFQQKPVFKNVQQDLN